MTLYDTGYDMITVWFIMIGKQSLPFCSRNFPCRVRDENPGSSKPPGKNLAFHLEMLMLLVQEGTRMQRVF